MRARLRVEYHPGHAHHGEHLAIRIDRRLEAIHLARREGHRHEARLCLRHAVHRPETGLPLLLPALAQSARGFDANVAQRNVPADAEVTHRLVATVVGANDLDGQAQYGHRHVAKRHREVAHLQVFVDGNVDGHAGLAVGRRAGQTNRIDAVEQHRRVKAAQLAPWHRASAGGKAGPGCAALLAAQTDTPARSPSSCPGSAICWQLSSPPLLGSGIIRT